MTLRNWRSFNPRTGRRTGAYARIANAETRTGIHPALRRHLEGYRKNYGINVKKKEEHNKAIEAFRKHGPDSTEFERASRRALAEQAPPPPSGPYTHPKFSSAAQQGYNALQRFYARHGANAGNGHIEPKTVIPPKAKNSREVARHRQLQKILKLPPTVLGADKDEERRDAARTAYNALTKHHRKIAQRAIDRHMSRNRIK